MKKIVIIGGGVAGLSAGQWLFPGGGLPPSALVNRYKKLRNNLNG
jgi:2-polyprenyl-6-methoxyphenol hydroxylase-like FAD-dependent oxidoreductase